LKRTLIFPILDMPVNIARILASVRQCYNVACASLVASNTQVKGAYRTFHLSLMVMLPPEPSTTNAPACVVNTVLPMLRLAETQRHDQ
jgi:hypothetical protein